MQLSLGLQRCAFIASLLVTSSRKTTPVCPACLPAGSTIRDIRFREQFNAAVVAVARKGERIRSKPGDIELRSGDILLLDTGSAFADQHKVRIPLPHLE